MEKYYTWNKGIFDSNYQVYEAGQIKSTMFFDAWRKEAKIITQQKSYILKNNGFIDPTTQIYDNMHQIIGSITYNTWKTKGMVILNSGEQYTFDFTNSWFSTWVITNFKDKKISYDSSTSSGTVMANTDDELMLLTGLYIRAYFNNLLIFVILVAVIFPIIFKGCL